MGILPLPTELVSCQLYLLFSDASNTERQLCDLGWIVVMYVSLKVTVSVVRDIMPIKLGGSG